MLAQRISAQLAQRFHHPDKRCITDIAPDSVGLAAPYALNRKEQVETCSNPSL